jgi:hypothetical protein
LLLQGYPIAAAERLFVGLGRSMIGWTVRYNMDPFWKDFREVNKVSLLKFTVYENGLATAVKATKLLEFIAKRNQPL